MREYPILFKDRLVRAILEDRKTQTRRVGPGAAKWLQRKKGDRLWVREAWFPKTSLSTGEHVGYEYRADTDGRQKGWKPSIHMPRTAARVFLELTEAPRVERLQAMTEADAIAEGVEPATSLPEGMGWLGPERPASRDLVAAGHKSEREIHKTALGAFEELWNSINGPRRQGWDHNPDVVVLTFKRVHPAELPTYSWPHRPKVRRAATAKRTG